MSPSAAGSRGVTPRQDPKVIVKVQGHIREGDRALSRGDAEAAEKAYIEAMDLDANNWKATWKLARVYEQQDRLDEAVQLLRDVIERFPANLAAHMNLARLLVRSGDYAEALRTLDHVVAVKSNHAEAHTLRGVVLYQLGRIDEARGAWEEALRWDPSHRLAAEFLGSMVRADGSSTD